MIYMAIFVRAQIIDLILFTVSKQNFSRLTSDLSGKCIKNLINIFIYFN